jgi:hypothetical protein
MDPLNNPIDADANDSATVDRTVTYVIVGLIVLMAFALMLSTFAQVNRITSKPTLHEAIPGEVRLPEIGRSTGSNSTN